MNKSPPAELIILGFGGHARAVADIALSAGVTRLIFVDAKAQPGETFAGFPSVAEIAGLPAAWLRFAAVGDSLAREALCNAHRGKLATLVAPDASIGVEATIAEGVLVARHAHVGAAASIGRGVIVNTGAIVEHETQIGEFTHVSINAAIAGRCRIGRHVMIGAGATVIDGVTITDGVIIGAGATVVSDIVEPGTYVGTPARLLLH